MSHLNPNIKAMGHRLVQGVEEIQRTKGDPTTWETATAADLTAHKDVYDILKNPALALQATQEATERGALPAGQYWTEAKAIEAAKLSGLRGPQIGYEAQGRGVYEIAPAEYRTYVKAGRWSFEEAADPIEDVSIERFTYRIDPGSGDLLRLSNIDPNRKDTVSEAPDKPTKGSRKIGDAVPTGFGYSLEIWESTDEFGNSNRYQVKIKDPDDRDIGIDSDIDLGEGRGDFVYLGDGKYEHVPDKKTPFEFDPTAGAGDVIPLEDQNGTRIRISENQYQFVRDTYEPGVKEWTDDQGITRQFSQSASGTWTELAPRVESDVVSIGDRDFLQQTTGALSELDPRYDPSIEEVDGMALLQQRSGAISQLAKPTLDQIITQALVDNDFDKALAFQDFRDRPTAQEAFQTALAFARAPADQRIISAIARGVTPVQPPPEGTVQRVGPQPDFLVKQYQDYLSRTQAGVAPTDEEAASLLARSAAGQTPETDTLQMRLEAMEADIARKDRESEARITMIFADMERKNRESEAKVKKYTSKPSDATGAAGTVADKTTETVEDTTEAAETAEAAASTAGASMAGYDPDPEWAASFAPDRVTGEQAHKLAVENRADIWGALGEEQQQHFAKHYARNINPNLSQEDLAKGGALESFQHSDPSEFEKMITTSLSATDTPITSEFNISGKAGGGIVGNREITVVGEKGPEIAMMPPGTHILPLGKATKQDIRAAQSTGRAYQEGGIVFDELAPGLQQLWRGRPITPPRGYLFQQGGLPLPSPQALQNLTPTVRESFYGMAGDIGISPADFRQELQAATPRGTRLPSSRMLPLGRRGVR
jgi:hypothetical protein